MRQQKGEGGGSGLPLRESFGRASRPPALPLGELEPFPRSRAPVFLAFLDPRIPRQESRALQHRTKLGVLRLQRLGQAVFHGLRLGRLPPPVDVDLHVDRLPLAREPQRLHGDRPQRENRKVVFELPPVDADPAAARPHVDPGDGRFPFPRRVDFRRLCHIGSILSYSLTASALGCWALWGWSGPAYTLSFVNSRSPSRVLGSIPRTAHSTSRSGCFEPSTFSGV